MTDQTKDQELESLKARADLLKVKYHPNIGIEALREKIKAADAAEDNDGEGNVKTEAPAKASAPVVETENQKRVRLMRETTKLVRIRLTCMNPAKKEWDGEIITAGNAAIGSHKRYIPFHADEGWHVPNIIFQVLKERMCPQFYTEKIQNGVSVRRSRMIKEFAIEVLDPLTPEELHDLAQRQAMAKSVG